MSKGTYKNILSSKVIFYHNKTYYFYTRGLQTRACRPNAAREAISSGPWSHFIKWL